MLLNNNHTPPEDVKTSNPEYLNSYERLKTLNFGQVLINLRGEKVIILGFPPDYRPGKNMQPSDIFIQLEGTPPEWLTAKDFIGLNLKFPDGEKE